MNRTNTETSPIESLSTECLQAGQPGTIDPTSGIIDPALGIIDPRPLLAMDFGAGGKLALFGERGDGTVGVIPVPRLKPRGRGTGARSDAEKFADRLHLLLATHTVVTESATVGSSGADTAMIDRIVADPAMGQLLLLPTRAMKNWVKDHGLAGLETAGVPGSRPTDQQSAEVQYRIAVANPAALHPYRPGRVTPAIRRFTSVRPADKRGYRGEYRGIDIQEWLSLLPDPVAAPTFLDEASGVEATVTTALCGPDGTWRPAAVLPFALALSEATADSRGGFEWTIGLYGHGYPSFYRRQTVTLMQTIAQASFPVASAGAIPASARKVSWRLTRRMLRWMYAHCDLARARTFATPA